MSLGLIRSQLALSLACVFNMPWFLCASLSTLLWTADRIFFKGIICYSMCNYYRIGKKLNRWSTEWHFPEVFYPLVSHNREEIRTLSLLIPSAPKASFHQTMAEKPLGFWFVCKATILILGSKLVSLPCVTAVSAWPELALTPLSSITGKTLQKRRETCCILRW